MKPLKLYFDTDAIAAPSRWREAVDDRSHVIQSMFFGFAPSKAALSRMVEERAPGYGHLVKETRVLGLPYPSDVQLFIEAGLIDPTVPGIFIGPLDCRPGDQVARIEPDGTPIVIGILRRNPMRDADPREWAEPVE